MVSGSRNMSPLEREGARNTAGCLLVFFVLVGVLALAYSLHVLMFRSRLTHEGNETTGRVITMMRGRGGSVSNVEYQVAEHKYVLIYTDLFHPLSLGQKVPLRYLPTSPMEAIVVTRSMPSSVVLAFLVSALFLSSSVQMFLRLRALAVPPSEEP